MAENAQTRPLILIAALCVSVGCIADPHPEYREAIVVDDGTGANQLVLRDYALVESNEPGEPPRLSRDGFTVVDVASGETRPRVTLGRINTRMAPAHPGFLWMNYEPRRNVQRTDLVRLSDFGSVASNGTFVSVSEGRIQSQDFNFNGLSVTAGEREVVIPTYDEEGRIRRDLAVHPETYAIREVDPVGDADLIIDETEADTWLPNTATVDGVVYGADDGSGRFGRWQDGAFEALADETVWAETTYVVLADTFALGRDALRASGPDSIFVTEVLESASELRFARIRLEDGGVEWSITRPLGFTQAVAISGDTLAIVWQYPRPNDPRSPVHHEREALVLGVDLATGDERYRVDVPITPFRPGYMAAM